MIATAATASRRPASRRATGLGAALALGLACSTLFAQGPNAQAEPAAPQLSSPAAPSASTHPLAERVGEDALAYLRLAGIEEAAQAGRQLWAAKILRHPRMAAAFRSLMAELPKPGQPSQEQQLFEAGMAVMSGGVEIVVDRTTLTWIFGQRGPDMFPMPAMVARIELGEGASRLPQLMGLLKSIPGMSAVGEDTLGDHEVLRWRVGNDYESIELHSAVLGTGFFVSNTPLLMRRTLDGSDTSLAQSESFRRGLHRSSGDGSAPAAESMLIEAFLNVRRLAGPLEAVFPYEAEAALEILGLDKVEAFTFQSGTRGSQGFDRSTLVSPAPHTGLLALDGGEALSAMPTRWMAPNALFGFAGRLDISKALDLVRTVAHEVAPEEMVDRIESQESQMMRRMGFGDATELAQVFGPEFALAVSAGTGLQPIGYPDVGLLLQVRDWQGFERILGAISEMESQFSWEKAQILGSGGYWLSFAQVKVPALIEGDRLLIHLGISGLDEARERVRGDAPGFGQSQRFAAAFAGMDATTASSISWVDPKGLISYGHRFLRDAWPTLSNILEGETGISLDEEAIPPRKVFEDNFEAWCGVSHTTAHGLTSQWRGPGYGLLWAGAAAIAADVPGFGPDLIKAFIRGPGGNAPGMRSSGARQAEQNQPAPAPRRDR